MMQTILNINWSSHTTNEQLCCEFPTVTDEIANRILKLEGYCYPHTLVELVERYGFGNNTWELKTWEALGKVRSLVEHSGFPKT
jgi:hypothetical protein